MVKTAFETLKKNLQTNTKQKVKKKQMIMIVNVKKSISIPKATDKQRPIVAKIKVIFNPLYTTLQKKTKK